MLWRCRMRIPQQPQWITDTQQGESRASTSPYMMAATIQARHFGLLYLIHLLQTAFRHHHRLVFYTTVTIKKKKGHSTSKVLTCATHPGRKSATAVLSKVQLQPRLIFIFIIIIAIISISNIYCQSCATTGTCSRASSWIHCCVITVFTVNRICIVKFRHIHNSALNG